MMGDFVIEFWPSVGSRQVAVYVLTKIHGRSRFVFFIDAEVNFFFLLLLYSYCSAISTFTYHLLEICFSCNRVWKMRLQSLRWPLGSFFSIFFLFWVLFVAFIALLYSDHSNDALHVFTQMLKLNFDFHHMILRWNCFWGVCEWKYKGTVLDCVLHFTEKNSFSQILHFWINFLDSSWGFSFLFPLLWFLVMGCRWISYLSISIFSFFS